MFTGKFEKFDIEELESFFEHCERLFKNNTYGYQVLNLKYNITDFDISRAIQKTLCNEIALLKSEIADLKNKKKRDVFTPPTLQECIDYAKEKNMTNINVQDYWDARERTNWCLASGAKIKKWTLDMNLMNRKGYYANGTHKPNTDTARRNAGAIQEDNG